MASSQETLPILDAEGERAQCPSARPEMRGSRLLGIMRRRAGERLLAYLDRPEPVSEELLQLAGPLSPTEFFRFAAPCVESGCAHFDGTDCRLASRIVRRVDAAVDEIPDCALRPACRWWRQEGDAACLRCPMIVTESYSAEGTDEELRLAADPATPV